MIEVRHRNLRSMKPLRYLSNKLTLHRLLASIFVSTAMAAEQWTVYETSFISPQKYEKPFVDVEVDVVFRSGDRQWKVPAFWAGDQTSTVRFAPPLPGDYTFQVKCSDPANPMGKQEAQALYVGTCSDDNPLLKHGFLRTAENKYF